ncbi:MAG TPA: hypothetical protein V6C57_00725 [Coleofasciculaceae cyanobacterium]
MKPISKLEGLSDRQISGDRVQHIPTMGQSNPTSLLLSKLLSDILPP